MDEQELEKTISLVCKRVEQLKQDQEEKLKQLEKNDPQAFSHHQSPQAEEQPS